MISALAVFAMALSNVWAGPSGYSSYSGGGGKSPVWGKGPVAPAPVDTGCDCFEAGEFTIDALAGYAFEDGGAVGDGWGGGVGFNYFLTEMFGAGLRYFAFDDDFSGSVHHDISASAILRYPIPSLCIAPYVLGGGGVLANGSNDGTAHIGGGLEMRCPDLTCTGVFVDGRYNWGKDNRDYSSVNFGLRFRF